jgi:hypothetical protein
VKVTFLAIIDGIKKYSGYYFSIISVLGVLWGAFAVFNNWKENNKSMQTSVKTIIETQMHQVKTDSILLKNQSDMQLQLSTIQSTTSSLSRSYVKYISNDKTLTKQDFLNYMEGLSFDVKKNLINYYQIPQKQEYFLIVKKQ